MLSQVVIHQHPKTPSISNYILEEGVHIRVVGERLVTNVLKMMLLMSE